MKRLHIQGIIAAPLIAILALGGCATSPSTGTDTSTPTPSASSTVPVTPPKTENVSDLQGASVELVVGQILNIDTGDLPTDSYVGKIADRTVGEFVKGSAGSPVTNPGIKALAAGTTEVVLSNDQGGIQDVTFSVTVKER